jgi:hypothetical protein
LGKKFASIRPVHAAWLPARLAAAVERSRLARHWHQIRSPAGVCRSGSRMIAALIAKWILLSRPMEREKPDV